MGYVARDCEGLPRLVLVFAVDRQKTFATHSIEFRQAEAYARLLDCREDAIKKRDTVTGTIGGE